MIPIQPTLPDQCESKILRIHELAAKAEARIRAPSLMRGAERLEADTILLDHLAGARHILFECQQPRMLGDATFRTSRLVPFYISRSNNSMAFSPRILRLASTEMSAVMIRPN